jgi:Ca2+-binding EF-hand superfamily protein
MKKILAVLTIMLFTAAWSFAAEDLFSKIDKNKDGKISKQEYMDAVAGTFDKLDKNHDGILTREEIKLNNIDVEKFIKEADTNKDGKINKKEFERAAEKSFSSMDKDKNGYIDKKEWNAARSAQNAPGLVIFTF